MAIKKATRHKQHKRPNRFRPLPQMQAQRFALEPAICPSCEGTGHMTNGAECARCEGSGAVQ